MIAAALALAIPATSDWVPVGMTNFRLRVFVERASVREAAGLRRARVRLGAPTPIAGRIVLVYQENEIDCGGGRWRMLGFEGRDEDGNLVQRSTPAAAPPPFLPSVAGTIGGEVARVVCALTRHAVAARRATH